MSVGRLAGLRAQLLGAGVAGDMPVAFIENASRSEQRVVSSSVDAMQRDAAASQVKAPTLMIIGHVAKSAAELQWFGRAAAQSA
jgi:siroheme synthase